MVQGGLFLHLTEKHKFHYMERESREYYRTQPAEELAPALGLGGTYPIFVFYGMIMVAAGIAFMMENGSRLTKRRRA